MEDYKQLIAQYKAEKANNTHRDRAKLERRIWYAALASIPNPDGALRSKREWLAKELDEIPNVIESHSTLLGYGDASEPLWARIQEDGIPLRTAVRLMRDAKARARAMKTSIAEQVPATLKEFDDLPAYRLPGGGISHKRSSARSSSTVVETDFVDEGEEEEEPEEEVEAAPRQQDDPRSFWANLRGMIFGYFHTRLSGLDQGAIEKVAGEMDVELKVVFEHFQHKLDRMRRDGTAQKMGVNRSKIAQACRTLNLEPPLKIDDEFRTRAKRQYRKLASLYHPDKSRTEETRDLYHNVIEAWHFLEDL